MPAPPFAAVSLVAHVSPAPPRSCTPTARPASSRARHASISRFSSNGSPTCTLGRLAVVLLPLAEAGRRQHAHPADAVATRATSRAARPIAGARRPPEHQPFDGNTPKAQDVDERVVGVRLVEHHLAAHGGHADRVAVAGDAGHDALGDPAAAGSSSGPKRRDPSPRSDGRPSRTRRAGCRRRRWPRLGRARRPTGGCGSRCEWRRRCRHRRRRRRRLRRARRAPTALRTASAAGAPATTCRSSARTT